MKRFRISRHFLLSVFASLFLAASIVALLVKAPSEATAESTFKGINYTFESEADDSRNVSGFKWMVNNGGDLTKIVADPLNPSNKVFRFSSDIANNAVPADLGKDGEWFMNTTDLALEQSDRYDVFSVDCMFPEPKDGGMALNDSLRFQIYGPGGVGNCVTFFVRASGAHLSQLNASSWSKTGLPHNKWISFKIIFDYEAFTCDLLYSIEGAAYQVAQKGFAIPAGWKVEGKTNHIVNYRATSTFTYYEGNANGFYTIDKCCYFDNMAIYSLPTLEGGPAVSLNKEIYAAGDTLVASAKNEDGTAYAGSVEYNWYTSADGTNFTLIPGATTNSYKTTAQDKQVKVSIKSYVSGTTILLNESYSNVAIQNPKVFYDNFEDYEIGTSVGTQASEWWQANDKPIIVKANPAGTGKVLEVSPGGLIQNRSNLEYLKNGNFVIESTFYLPEGFADQINVQVYSGSTNQIPVAIKNGFIYAGSTKTIANPTQKEFKLICAVSDFQTANLYMLMDGEYTLIKANYQAFDDAFKTTLTTGGVTRVRIGTSSKNTKSFYLDDISVKLAPTLSNVSLEAKEGVTYKYDGEEKSLEVKGLTSEIGTLLGIANNKAVNAGTYDVCAIINKTQETYGYTNLAFVTAVMTVEQGEYDMSSVAFENKTEAYNFGNHVLEVTGLPSGLTVEKYMVSTSEFTGAIEPGAYEITAVLANSNANFKTPENLVATLTITRPSLDALADTTFEDASYPFDGASHTIEVKNLPQGYKAVYLLNGEAFSGTQERGIHEVEARIYTSDDLAVISYTATLTILNVYDETGIKFEDLTVTYDGASHTVEVKNIPSEEISVKYYIGTEEFTGAIEPGTYEVTAKFATTNASYAAPKDVKATITINKIAAPSLDGVSFKGQTVTYDGASHYLVIEGTLPEKVSVHYYLNGAAFTGVKAPGTYEIEARFISEDAHYENPTSLKANLVIEELEAKTNGLNLTFDSMELGTKELDGVYKFQVNNGGSTGVVVDPTDSSNKVLKFTTDIAKHSGDDYRSNGEWFNGVANFAFDKENRYDVFSVDLMIPEPKDGGMVLNDNIAFNFYGPGGTASGIRVFVRGSGAHISKANESSWAKTSIAHGKWFNITIVFDYETFTCNVFYTLAGGATELIQADVAIPEAWKGQATNYHMLNYRVQTDFIYYEGNENGFYTIDKCCYMDNLKIYSTNSLSPVSSIKLSNYVVEEDTEVVATAIGNDGKAYNGNVAYEWYTSADGNTFKLIYGASGNKYTIKAEDKFVRAVAYIEENGIIVQNISSIAVLQNPTVFENDFEKYVIDTTIGTEASDWWQANDKPITVKENPAGDGKVLEMSTGSLLQNRFDLNYLKSGDYMALVSYYMPENFEGNTAFTPYSGKTGAAIYKLVGGQVVVGSAKVNYPTNTWFTLVTVVTGFDTVDVYMVVANEITVVATDYKPFQEDLVKAFKQTGVTRFRIGASNNTAFLIDNVDVSLLSLTEASFNDSEVGYNGNAQSLTLTGLNAGEALIASSLNAFTNAGKYEVVGLVNVAGVINGYSKFAICKGELTIVPTAYDKEFNVTFEDKEATYTGEKVVFEVTGTIPEDITATYYLNDEILTEDLVDAGEYEVTVVFEVEDTNYQAPQSLTAKLTIKKAEYVLEGIAFEDNSVDYTGTTYKLEVAGELPEDVTVSYTVDGEAFNGASEPGTYVVTAVFTTTNPNYNNPTSITKTLVIVQRTYDMSGVKFEDVTVVYDGTQKSALVDESTLPEGVTVRYENNSKTSAGTYTVTAKFTGDPSYADIADMTATLTITKATYDMSNIKLEDLSVEFDGEKHSIRIEGTLPEGVTVSYTGNGVSEVGVYTVTAKFESENQNYEAIADMTATITITEKPVVKPTKKGCKESVGVLSIGGLMFLACSAYAIKKRKENE